jgi:quercetin dioxygenase-like cupin family protein
MKMKSVSAFITAALLTLGMSSMALAAKVPTYDEVQAKMQHVNGTVFPIGSYNTAYAPYFTGHTFLASITKEGVPISNVTFIDGAHTFWHIHHGTCQILVAESGHGYYQIWGEDPKKLEPGTTVTIPEGVKHWHGAAPGVMFQHLSIMEPKQSSTEWLEPVDDALFQKLAK